MNQCGYIGWMVFCVGSLFLDASGSSFHLSLFDANHCTWKELFCSRCLIKEGIWRCCIWKRTCIGFFTRAIESATPVGSYLRQSSSGFLWLSRGGRALRTLLVALACFPHYGYECFLLSKKPVFTVVSSTITVFALLSLWVDVGLGRFIESLNLVIAMFLIFRGGCKVEVLMRGMVSFQGG